MRLWVVWVADAAKIDFVTSCVASTRACRCDCRAEAAGVHSDCAGVEDWGRSCCRGAHGQGSARRVLVAQQHFFPVEQQPPV